MQAREHLVERRFQAVGLLQVVEARLQPHFWAIYLASQGLEAGERGGCQGGKDARCVRFTQGWNLPVGPSFTAPRRIPLLVVLSVAKNPTSCGSDRRCCSCDARTEFTIKLLASKMQGPALRYWCHLTKAIESADCTGTELST